MLFYSRAVLLPSPMALASGRINKLLYVPDIEPGLALKIPLQIGDSNCGLMQMNRENIFQKKLILSLPDIHYDRN